MVAADHSRNFIQLEESVPILMSRCMYLSSKWSAEIIASLSSPISPAPFSHNSNFSGMTSTYSIPSYDMEYLLAKSYFDNREYDRTVWTLSKRKDSIGLFLKWYATLIAGEKRIDDLDFQKEHSFQENSETLVLKKIKMKENELYLSLIEEMEIYHASYSLDAFQLYLYGLLLSKVNRFEESRTILIKSITAYQYLWSAWTILSSILFNEIQFQEAVTQLASNNPTFLPFFKANFYLQSFEYKMALPILTELENLYKKHPIILTSLADIYHNLKEFTQSESYYQEYMKLYPFALEGLDAYSNMLYVQENIIGLTILAQKASDIDPYRVETNFILGNFYSLKGDHEKAIQYFTRCTHIFKRYLPAWALLGHEYIELKNSEAAVRSYTTAIEMNPREYRAWFGLGQTMEMMKKPHDALYYYKKAALIRPKDPRMWTAIGSVYELLSKNQEAVLSYERAFQGSSLLNIQTENDILNMGKFDSELDAKLVALECLAKLFIRLNDHNKAVYYYAIWLKYIIPNIDRPIPSGNSGIIVPEAVEPCLFLAQYYFQKKNWQEALKYAKLIIEIPGPEKEEAKSILYECHSNM